MHRCPCSEQQRLCSGYYAVNSGECRRALFVTLVAMVTAARVHARPAPPGGEGRQRGRPGGHDSESADPGTGGESCRYFTAALTNTAPHTS